MPRLFVYGTLKTGGRYWEAYARGGTVGQPISARVRGRLYHLPAHGYPALTREDGWALGELITLRGAAALARIDALEGFREDRPASGNEYRRVRAQVYTPARPASGGEPVPLATAWAYFMDSAKVRELGGQPVPGGDWPHR